MPKKKTPKATQRKGPPPAPNGSTMGDALPTAKDDALVVAAPAVPASAAAPVKKSPAKKSPAKKAPVKKSPAPPKKEAAAKPAKVAAKKATPKKRAPSRNKGKPRGWAEKLLVKNLALLGTVSDQVVSDRLKMSAEAVRQFRKARGIKSVTEREAASGQSIGKRTASAAKKAHAKAVPATAKAAPVTAKAAAVSKKTPPASKPAAPKRVAALVKPQGATSVCWRVSVRDGEPVHIIADTLSAAALRVEKALGTAAIGIEYVSPGIG